jgi:uncharacterized DUF497 family protein
MLNHAYTSMPQQLKRIFLECLTSISKKYYYISIMERKITWTAEKEAENTAKHHISFETARLIFGDIERIERIDNSESNTSGEERWQTIGRVGKLLFVVYMERGDETRLISARKAEKQERRSYNGYYNIDGKGWTKAN